MLGRPFEGNGLQVITLRESVGLDGVDASGYHHVIQIVTIKESVLLYLPDCIRDNHFPQVFLLFESHLPNYRYPFGDAYALQVGETIHQARPVGRQHQIPVKIKTVTSYLLQSEIQHQVVKLTFFLGILLQDLKNRFFTLLHNLLYLCREDRKNHRKRGYKTIKSCHSHVVKHNCNICVAV